MTDEQLRFALSALSRGGVVAAATETFFGLLADPRLPGALDKLFALKGRAALKGVALLLPGKEAWRALVAEIPPLAERLADRFWPGPLSIALEARPELDRRLTVDGTVAVRWPGPSDAARITEAFGAPLTATSANVTGAPACASAEEVKKAFSAALGRGELAVVPGRASGGEPSTLVAVTPHGVRIVRSGRIRESDLSRLVPASARRQM
jgi:L-threonylcarbamoyladenylate synthase